MAELYSTLSIIFYIVAILFFIAAVLIFIALKIPRVFSDLTGRTARKNINRTRATNEKSGKKFYGPSDTNKSRGKVTDTMPQTKKEDLPGTGIIEENKAKNVNSESTMLLEDNSTTLLDENGTSELNETNQQIPNNAPKVDLEIIDEVMFVHTDEVIS